MKIVKPFTLLFLFLFILSLSNGCATLPNVSEKWMKRLPDRNLAGSFRPKVCYLPRKARPSCNS